MSKLGKGKKQASSLPKEFVTEQAMFTADAYMRMAEDVRRRGAENPEWVTVKPVLTNGAPVSVSSLCFAIELYLKVLIWLTRNKHAEWGHDLGILFSSVPMEWSSAMSTRFEDEFKLFDQTWETALTYGGGDASGKWSKWKRFRTGDNTMIGMMDAHARGFEHGRYFFELKDVNDSDQMPFHYEGLKLAAEIFRDTCIRTMNMIGVVEKVARTMPEPYRSQRRTVKVSLGDRDPVPRFPPQDD